MIQKHMTLTKSKKAVSYEFTLWMIRFIILGIGLYGISLILNTGTYNLLTTHTLEYTVLLERPLYSSFGFAYQDPETQRVYPHIIDKTRFTDAVLTEVFNQPTTSLPSRKLGMRYILDNQMIYFNKQQFDIISPLTWSEKYGRVQRNVTVLVRGTQDASKEKIELIPKTMVMEIVFEK